MQYEQQPAVHHVAAEKILDDNGSIQQEQEPDQGQEQEQEQEQKQQPQTQQPAPIEHEVEEAESHDVFQESRRAFDTEDIEEELKADLANDNDDDNVMDVSNHSPHDEGETKDTLAPVIGQMSSADSLRMFASVHEEEKQKGLCLIHRQHLRTYSRCNFSTDPPVIRWPSSAFTCCKRLYDSIGILQS